MCLCHLLLSTEACQRRDTACVWSPMMLMCHQLVSLACLIETRCLQSGVLHLFSVDPAATADEEDASKALDTLTVENDKVSGPWPDSVLAVGIETQQPQHVWSTVQLWARLYRYLGSRAMSPRPVALDVWSSGTAELLQQHCRWSWLGHVPITLEHHA